MPPVKQRTRVTHLDADGINQLYGCPRAPPPTGGGGTSPPNPGKIGLSKLIINAGIS